MKRIAHIAVVARDAIAGLSPRTILFVTWLLVVLYGFPGYLNWDSGEQIYQVRTGYFGDAHPPMMALYWRVIEIVMRGPFPLLVLQTSLFLWGMYAILKMRFSPRASAWIAVALMVFPPILTPMAAVWKDAQMAGFLIAGFALTCTPRWRTRAIGLVLLMLAAGVRDNAVAALPPMCLVMVATWGLRRKLVIIGAGALVCISIYAASLDVNEKARDVHEYVLYSTTMLHDIAGTICFADPLSDEQVREILHGMKLVAIPDRDLQAKMCKEYRPRVFFNLLFGGVEHNVFSRDPQFYEREARKAAWMQLVREYPGAYLKHRWLVMKELLGITQEKPWEPVCQTIGANQGFNDRVDHDASLSEYQQKLGRWFIEKWSLTVFYRAWFYAVLSLIVLGYAAIKRRGLIAALVGSGLLYELSFYVGTAAPDWRYSHWMVTTCGIALVMVFGERFAAARRTP